MNDKIFIENLNKKNIIKKNEIEKSESEKMSIEKDKVLNVQDKINDKNIIIGG